MREDLPKRKADTASERRQLRADIVLRGGEADRDHSARPELPARLPEEFQRVETVELRGLRIGQIDDDDVEGFPRALQKKPAIDAVDPHPGITLRRIGEILAGKLEDRRVQLHVVQAAQTGVLERLGEASVDAAADEQQADGRGVLQESVVYGFLGRLRIGLGGYRQTVLVERHAAFVAHHDQVAVKGVGRSDNVEGPPQPDD